MIQKTKGIVLSYIKYKETSIITKIYTSEFGLRSYIINGVRSKKSRGKIALYQPLTILELDVYEQKSKNIQRIADAKCAQPYQSLPFEIHKTTISIFLAEFLYKLLQKEEEKDIEKYLFLEKSLTYFDQTTTQINLFHIQFLAKTITFSGILPENTTEIISQLNEKHSNKYALNNSQQHHFESLFTKNYTDSLNISSQERSLFLNIILAYFQLHDTQLNHFKSLQILQEVFHS